jgi:stress-induced-phosphoprotein 1
MKDYHKALATFDEAAKIDPKNADLLDSIQQTRQAISSANASGEVDPERQRRALEDPEIQAILRDPTMSRVLQDLQTDPKSGAAALKDPKIRANIEKLAAAGIIKIG